MKKVAAIVVLSSTLAQVAQASDRESGAYLGAGIVHGTITEVFRSESGAPLDGVDRTSFGYRVLGGYAFNRYVSAELSYIDGVKAVSESVGNLGSSYGEVKARTVGIAAVGKLPLGERYAVLGKLGYADWSMSAMYEDRPVGFPVESASANFSDRDFFYGAGIAMQATEALELRAEYEVTKLYSPIKLRTIGISAAWHF